MDDIVSKKEQIELVQALYWRARTNIKNGRCGGIKYHGRWYKLKGIGGEIEVYEKPYELRRDKHVRWTYLYSLPIKEVLD